MDLGLRGKGAVITGGSKGIGRAIALGLAREGAGVAICARGETALRETEAELRALDVPVLAQSCDVADAAALDRFLDAAKAALGRIDILVSNASAIAFGNDEAAWKSSIDIDVMAAVRSTWKVVPDMTASGGGAIIYISSGSGLEAGSPPAYAAAKAALISLSKTMAVALAPNNIRINVVLPGSIEFPGGVWASIKQGSRPMYDAVLATIPSGRMGLAEEVADTVVFLASARANWVRGAAVRVDGGQGKANL